MQRKLAPAFTESEWADLELLRWMRIQAPQAMTERAWAKLRDLEAKLQWRTAFLRLLQTRRWSRGLTRQKIAELDRKTAAGEPLTCIESMQWATVVRRYHDLKRRAEDVTGHWSEDDPVADLVSFDDVVASGRCRNVVARSRPGARRRTSRRAARSPGRPGAADDGPHEHDLAALVAAA